MGFYEIRYNVMKDQYEELSNTNYNSGFDLKTELDYQKAYYHLRNKLLIFFKENVLKKFEEKLIKYFPMQDFEQNASIMNYVLQDAPVEAYYMYNRVFRILSLAEAGQIEDAKKQMVKTSQSPAEMLDNYGILLKSYYAPEFANIFMISKEKSREISNMKKLRKNVAGFDENGNLKQPDTGTFGG